jgi:hypothetical protein
MKKLQMHSALQQVQVSSGSTRRCCQKKCCGCGIVSPQIPPDESVYDFYFQPTAFVVIDPLDVVTDPTSPDFGIPVALVEAGKFFFRAIPLLKVNVPAPDGTLIRNRSSAFVICTQPIDEYYHLLGNNLAERLATVNRWADWAVSNMYQPFGFTIALGPIATTDEPASVEKADFVVEILKRSATDFSIFVTIKTSDGESLFYGNMETAALAWQGFANLPLAPNDIFPPPAAFCALGNVPPGTPWNPSCYGSSDGSYNVFRGGQKITLQTGGKAFSFATVNTASFVYPAVSVGDLATREAAFKAALLPAYEVVDDTGQSIQQELSDTGFVYLGQDDTFWSFVNYAPIPGGPNVVSTGELIEALSGVPFGQTGTVTACAYLTQWNRETLEQSGNILSIGLRGLMIGPGEDVRTAFRVQQGQCGQGVPVGIQQLLFYSGVCGTGADSVYLPSDTTIDQYVRLCEDMSKLSNRLGKGLTNRFYLYSGLKLGDCGQGPPGTGLPPTPVMNPEF